MRTTPIVLLSALVCVYTNSVFFFKAVLTLTVIVTNQINAFSVIITVIKALFTLVNIDTFWFRMVESSFFSAKRLATDVIAGLAIF